MEVGVEPAAARDVIDVVIDAGLEGTELDQVTPDAERLIAEAVQVARADRAGGVELAALVARFWRLVADEDMIGRTPEDLVAATLSHRELASTGRPARRGCARPAALRATTRYWRS
jgi:hypothetical protein